MPKAAKASEFGQILVNGTFTFSLMVGLSVGDTTLNTLVANLGYDKLVMPGVHRRHAARRDRGYRLESKSRPGSGIVTFLHRCINQRDEIVCQCERAALIKERPPDAPAFTPLRSRRPPRALHQGGRIEGADAIILDLEDSVSPANKETAVPRWQTI